mgnify:FL=1
MVIIQFVYIGVSRFIPRQKMLQYVFTSIFLLFKILEDNGKLETRDAIGLHTHQVLLSQNIVVTRLK